MNIIARYIQYRLYTFLVLDRDTTRNNIGYFNVYICKVGMSPTLPLIFSFDPLEWVNY